MKKLILAASSLLILGAANAATPQNAFSLDGYVGNINNNSGYIIECSQVIGGYCANNPMPANGYIQMLPDPGSNSISGHIMVIDKDNPNGYADNLTFKYQRVKDHFQFSITSLYNKVSVKTIEPGIVVLEKGAQK